MVSLSAWRPPQYASVSHGRELVTPGKDFQSSQHGFRQHAHRNQLTCAVSNQNREKKRTGSNPQWTGLWKSSVLCACHFIFHLILPLCGEAFGRALQPSFWMAACGHEGRQEMKELPAFPRCSYGAGSRIIGRHKGEELWTADMKE